MDLLFSIIVIVISLSSHAKTEQDPYPGSGTDLEYGDHLDPLLQFLCSIVDPEVCERSPIVCPCGSFQESVINPNLHNDFHLIQFVPCSPIHSRRATFRDCDVFVEYGALEAETSLKTHRELEYLYLACFTMVLETYQPDDLAYTVHVLQKLQQELNVFGVLGPSDPAVLEIMSHVAGNVYKKLIISYSTSSLITENRERYPHFYSTIPSSDFFVEVTLKLLSDFGWRRVAVISSSDTYHLGNTETLLRMASSNSSFELSFLNSYDTDPTPLLDQFKRDDFRVFVVNIDSSKARTLFCKALRLNLTTPVHQWILPSFYDHNWWMGDCNLDRDDGCCTNEEILDASLGTIFVGESTVDYGNSTNRVNAFSVLEDIYEFVITNGIDPDVVDIRRDDKLFLLHSRALYTYDAYNLFAIALNEALIELFNSTRNSTQPRDDLCDSLRSTSSEPFSSNVLTEKMIEVMDRSVFCGYSGYYVLANSSTKGQAWITQFQYYPNCSNKTDIGNFKEGESLGCYKESDIGHYANFDKPKECEYFKLQRVSELDNLESLEFRFTNSCCGQSGGLISSRPYMWKGDNPWKPPTDGACHDDSCRCWNRLGLTELVVGCVITLTGILLCCALLVVNFWLRNNKHIKASSPRFNSIVIIGCLMLYCVPVFNTISLTGDYLKVDFEKLIPASCEIAKWFGNIGFTLIISTLVCRNWRIYRIFFNPRIKERKYLSNLYIFILILLLLSPTVIIVVLWTGIDRFSYNEIRETGYPCPGLDIDNSITTYRLTAQCASDHFLNWEGTILAYNALLGALLIFLAYQNSTISSHFAQEGEFASKAMFLITLFLVPTFAINLAVTANSILDLTLLFWIRIGYHTFFPTVLLLGLYIQKFILIMMDRRTSIKERRTIRLQQTLQLEYESKVNEIEDLKCRLRSKQESDGEFETIEVRLRNSSITSASVSFNFLGLRKSPSPISPSPLVMNQRTFF